MKDKARILVVEDDAILATHLEQTLGQMGYQPVGLAATGKDAVRKAASLEPDVILIDVRLRGAMSGVEAAEAIHSAHDIPVIYLTAYADEPLIQKAKLTEPYAYLAKPVRDSELRASIEMALYKHLSERRVAHLNQVLRAVRDVNQLITREKDRQKLLDEACQILTRTRGYQLAWIGHKDRKAPRLLVMASAGPARNMLARIAASGTDKEAAKLPCATAQRTKKAVVSKNILEDPRYAPWHAVLRNSGRSSSAAIPMLHEAEVYGVLCVHADRPDAFDDDEIELLGELAGDLGFALYSLQQQEMRLKAEESLAQTEHIYRQAITEAGGVPYQRDFGEEGYTFLGEGITALTGYTAGEMTGDLFTSRLRQIQTYGEYQDLSHKERIRLARRGLIKEWREDYLFERKDGSLVWLADHSVPLYSESGKAIGSLGILMDITERKQAEQALRESEERFRSLFENMGEGVALHELVLDEAGQPINYRIVECNPTYERLLGIRREDAVGLLATEAYGVQDAPYLKEYSQVALAGIPASLETFFAPMDKYFDISIAPWERNGFATIFNDISERKRAEQALLRSQHNLAEAQQIAHIGSHEYDALKDELYFSDEVFRIFGFSRDDYEDAEEAIFRHIHPEDLERVERTIDEAIARREPVEFEFRIIRPDGEVRTLSERFQAFFDEEGKRIRNIGTVQDITERKQAEQSLAESEIKFRWLYEYAPVAYHLLTPDGLITDVNRRWCELLGYPREEVLGKAIFDFIVEEERAAAQASFERKKQSRQFFVEGSERNFRTRDGAVRTFKTYDFFTLDDGQEVAAVQTTIEDITERKQAEGALRESEERYRSVYENSTIGIYRTTRDGRILLANPAIVRMLGYQDFEELAQRNLEQEGYGLGFSRVDFCELVESQGEVRGLETVWVKSDGSIIYVRESARVVYSEDGKPLYYEGTVEDVTERMQAEAALRESERRLSALMANLPGMAYRCRNDPDWTMEFVSEGSRALSGYAPGDLIGGRAVSYATLIHPDDRSMVWDEVQQALVEDRPYRLTYRILSRDGVQKWVWEQGAAVRDAAGQVVALEGFIADITENRRAEESIRRQVTELEVLYESGLSVSRLLDPKEIAGAMIEVLAQKMDWHHAAVRLYHPETDRIELLALSEPELSAGEIQAQIERLNRVLARPGKGLSGWVIQHGKTVRSGDVGSDERYYRTFPGIRSGIYVPLRVVERVVGCIVVESEQPDAFGEHDERLLETLAAQAAIAFENARHYQQVVRAAERQKVIHRAGQEIAAAGLDLEAVYAATYRAAVELMNADVFTIVLYEPENQEIEAVYLREGERRLPVLRRPFGAGISSRVIRERKPLRIADYRKKPVKAVFLGQERETRSILAVPMFSGDVALGAVSIRAYQPGQYGQDDESLMEMLAAYAGTAIDNARLFEKERRQRQLAEALRNALSAGASLSAHLDLEVVLDQLLEALERVIPFDGANFMLVDRRTRRVQVARTRGYEKIGAEVAARISELGLEIDATPNLVWMEQNKQPMIVPDTAVHSEWVKIKEFAVIRSSAGAPIIVDDEVIGFFSLDKLEANYYRPEHAELLRAFTGQAALALQNARNFEQVHQRLEELGVLAEVSAALRSALTRAEMLVIMLDQLVRLLHVDDASLVIHDPATNENVVELARGSWAQGIGMRLKPGEGLGGLVAQTLTPYTNEDVLKEPKSVARTMLDQSEAVAGMPLRVQEEYIGSLWIGRLRSGNEQAPAPFTPNEMRLLGSIADMAANALHRATLHEQAIRHAEQLATVNEIGRILAETLELPVVYRRLTDAIYQLLPDICSVFISLYDEREGQIVCACAHSDGSFANNEELPPLPLARDGGGRQSQVILTGKPLIADDLADQDPALPHRLLVGDPGKLAQSGLYVPMITQGKVIGIVQVQSYTKGRFAEPEKELLNLVANTAAVAIENARLFDETQKRLRNLSALHTVDTAISASVDLRITLGILLEQAASELRVDATAILLFDPATRLLAYTATHGFYAHLIEGMQVRLGDGLPGQVAQQRLLRSIPDLGSIPASQKGRQALSGVYEDEGFVTYHGIPLIAKGQVQGVLETFHRSPLNPDEEWFAFFEMLAGRAAIAIDDTRLFENLQRSNLNLSIAYDATIQGWSQALELRDKETEGHTQRVTDLALNLAREAGIPETEMDHIRRGALLHDIGKMGIPDAILLKPASLTDEEWKIMRLHPVYAHEMLSEITYLRPALDIPHYHHERWDGSGYPEGLKGEQIPLSARIFAVVDVWDALTSDRPYRPAWTPEEALAHIKNQAGKHFDPGVVEVFLKLDVLNGNR